MKDKPLPPHLENMCRNIISKHRDFVLHKKFVEYTTTLGDNDGLIDGNEVLKWLDENI